MYMYVIVACQSGAIQDFEKGGPGNCITWRFRVHAHNLFSLFMKCGGPPPTTKKGGGA